MIPQPDPKDELHSFEHFFGDQERLSLDTAYPNATLITDLHGLVYPNSDEALNDYEAWQAAIALLEPGDPVVAVSGLKMLFAGTVLRRHFELRPYSLEFVRNSADGYTSADLVLPLDHIYTDDTYGKRLSRPGRVWMSAATVECVVQNDEITSVLNDGFRLNTLYRGVEELQLLYELAHSAEVESAVGCLLEQATA